MDKKLFVFIYRQKESKLKKYINCLENGIKMEIELTSYKIVDELKKFI
jgi:hypothetical protein